MTSSGRSRQLETRYMNDDKAFLDTNILVYAHDRGAGLKQQIAGALVERLWQKRKGVLSIQVLHEFYVNIRRKALNPLGPKAAKQLLADCMSWEVVCHRLSALRILSRLGMCSALTMTMIAVASTRSPAAGLVRSDPSLRST